MKRPPGRGPSPTSGTTTNGHPGGHVDFSVHGVVRVRFVGAPERVTDRFAAQWGPCLAPPGDATPDIVVRFADLSPTSLRHVGLRWAAASDEHFYALDEVDGSLTARLPMAELGGPCEVVCRRATTSVPYLAEVICLAFLGKGYAPLHGSAFVHDGVGVVTMGWPKGGKTGALLAFLGHGARYVGDEWVVLTPDGSTVLGLPLSLSVSEWQLPYLGVRAADLGAQKRLVFRAIHLLDRFATFLRRGRFARSEPVKLLDKGMPALRRQLKVTRSIRAWFGEDVGPLTASPDRFFLLMSHDADDIRVEREDADRIARSMVSANEHEWRPLLELYRGYTFAFPDRRNPLLEELRTRLGEPLGAAFAGRPVYRVLHPYGGPLDALFAALRPHCGPPPQRR
jgi:hypothetical protein